MLLPFANAALLPYLGPICKMSKPFDGICTFTADLHVYSSHMTYALSHVQHVWRGNIIYLARLCIQHMHDTRL